MFRVKDSLHVNAPIDRCFLLSTSIDLVRETIGLKPVAGKRSGLVVDGDQLLWRGWKFGLPGAGQGEVLLRVSATRANPIDYKMRTGAAKAMFPVEFPGILGRDVAGIVRAVGPGVSGFAAGDRVFALALRTYAELCVVKADALAKIPDGMDLPRAGALPLVLQTGEQLIRLGTGITAGQTVLVAGLQQGGVYASVVGPPANAALHPTVKVVPVGAVPDSERLVALAEEVHAGRLVIPINRMLPLAEAGEGQAAAEKGLPGKVLLLV